MPTFESRVLIRAPPGDVFAFLSRPENVPLFAPGVEDAKLLGGAAGLQGAWLGLRTRGGHELRAQITHFHEGSDWTVVDERDTVAQMQVEAAPEGTVLTATLKGHWRPEQEKRVRQEWEHIIHELPARVE
ncbi:MAG TPA: SRPBCC family protein [Candidatus Thermoplasmatota archaeon]|nr:SRPBCC family protein [Candidatus Thermoplasmatota archaeon]